jgi:ligand-binding SRPBCC domain-containing protein
LTVFAPKEKVFSRGNQSMIRQTGNVLHRKQWVPASLPEVFSFFSEARNLNQITPRWLHFNVLGQTNPRLRAGTLIHYKLAWYGIPLNWTTLIEEWSPPTMFVDIQLKGPYRFWRHVHSFEERDGGTLIKDTVHYAVPMGALGDFCFGWVVRRDLKRVFDYRAKKISAIFEEESVLQTWIRYGCR